MPIITAEHIQQIESNRDIIELVGDISPIDASFLHSAMQKNNIATTLLLNELGDVAAGVVGAIIPQSKITELCLQNLSLNVVRTVVKDLTLSQITHLSLCAMESLQTLAVIKSLPGTKITDVAFNELEPSACEMIKFLPDQAHCLHLENISSQSALKIMKAIPKTNISKFVFWNLAPETISRITSELNQRIFDFHLEQLSTQAIVAFHRGLGKQPVGNITGSLASLAILGVLTQLSEISHSPPFANVFPPNDSKESAVHLEEGNLSLKETAFPLKKKRRRKKRATKGIVATKDSALNDEPVSTSGYFDRPDPSRVMIPVEITQSTFNQETNKAEVQSNAVEDITRANVEPVQRTPNEEFPITAVERRNDAFSQTMTALEELVNQAEEEKERHPLLKTDIDRREGSIQRRMSSFLDLRHYLPPSLQFIISFLQQNHRKVFIHEGALRDFIVGRRSNDYDSVTTAFLTVISRFFPGAIYSKGKAQSTSLQLGRSKKQAPKTIVAAEDRSFNNEESSITAVELCNDASSQAISDREELVNHAKMEHSFNYSETESKENESVPLLEEDLDRWEGPIQQNVISFLDLWGHLPPITQCIISVLQQNSWKVFIYGGAIRDFILGHRANDYDLITTAPLEVISAILPVVSISGKGKVQSISLQLDGIQHDISTLDIAGADSLDSILAIHSSKCDFDINGLIWDPTTGLIKDFFGGLQALAERRINVVGDPESRYSANPNMILRAIRFSQKLNFALDPASQIAIFELKNTLYHIDHSKLSQEYHKWINCFGVQYTQSLLIQYGLYDIIVSRLSQPVPIQMVFEDNLYSSYQQPLSLQPQSPSLVQNRYWLYSTHKSQHTLADPQSVGSLSTDFFT